jgi:hypothetical protein
MAYTGAVNLYPIRKGSLADHLSLSDIAYKRVIAASCITPTRSAVFWQALGESIWFKPSYNGNTLEIEGERIVRVHHVEKQYHGENHISCFFKCHGKGVVYELMKF